MKFYLYLEYDIRQQVVHQNFHMSLNLGQKREGRGREGSKTIDAQNKVLQLSAINLIGLTIIYFAKSLKCS